MRRGRGKGKKQNLSAREDHGSGEEEKFSAYRRRGRPLKPMKDDFEEEEDEIVERTDDEDEEEEADDDTVTGMKKRRDLKNEKKRKISNGVNTDENELGSISRTDGSIKSTSNGFRQKGSRRKNKPRRAAEAVVECESMYNNRTPFRGS